MKSSVRRSERLRERALVAGWIPCHRTLLNGGLWTNCRPATSSKHQILMKKNPIQIALFIAVLTMPMLAWSKDAAHERVPAGAPMAESIRFEFAVYFLSIPPVDPIKVLKHELSASPNAPHVVEKIPDMPSGEFVQARLEKDAKNKYRPPDDRLLQYFGHGLSREQAQSLQDSNQVLILDFAHPKKYVWDALRTANLLVERLARQTNGLIWDEETREIFTPDEWHARRLSSWNTEIPIVAKQTIIHAYKNTEFVRAITLGMSKMGLPDVVVDDFPWSSNHQVGNLINDFCQTMAEGASFGPRGEFDLDLKAIQNASVRDAELHSTKANATSVARLTLELASPEQGDANNRLIRITADRYPGADRHAKQETMFSSFFGSDDAIVRIKHTDALLKASEEARTRLPALKSAFNSGLKPGEYILVKAPFATSTGGTERMWVEVSSWENATIRGLLQNDPFDIPTLHAGQVVVVDEGRIFDYIRHMPNGTQEGNATSKIIEQMEAQQQKK